MLRTDAVLLLGLLGLVAPSQAQVAPPLINISLDDPAEERWKPLLNVFNVDDLKKAGAEIIDSTVPKWVHKALTPVVAALENYIPQPYAAEIRGMASHFGGEIADVIMLNFAYEVSAFCTSIVAQDIKGHIYHGRNLDYPHSVLRNLTFDAVFLKNGEVAYRGTSFAGYVGLWTGQSPNKFTVSGDQRGSKRWWNWWKNMVSAVLFKRTPVSWLLRKTLEEAEDFQDAVMRLSQTPIIAEVYYIVGGVRGGQGVVITRDRDGLADIWPLDSLGEGWFRVESNYDHWLPDPAHDHRRYVANTLMNFIGQKHINMTTLYQVLSMHPLCNWMTVYTTTMSAATPEMYTTRLRELAEYSCSDILPSPLGGGSTLTTPPSSSVRRLPPGPSEPPQLRIF